MGKKRMTLSLVALISSVFLFVLASFAWFAVSEIVDIGSNILNVVDLDVEATLEVSDNEVDYVSADSIVFTNSTPGSIKYYRLTITNVGNIDCYTKVSMDGFVDGPTDITVTYDDSKTLSDVIILNSSYNVNSGSEVYEIEGETMTDSLTGTLIFLATSIYLDVDDVAILKFSFLISGSDTDNYYQNLDLSIGRLLVQSATP